MARTVDSYHVTEHQGEVAALFELSEDSCTSSLIKTVEVSGILAFELLHSVEVLPEHRSPDMISVENDFRLFASCCLAVFNLMEHVVFFNLASIELFRSLEESGQTP